MSVQKIQANRALRVIPSNNCNVPYPIVIQTGTNTTLVAVNNLTDSAAAFLTNNVKTGDIVYNITDNTAATVVSVSSETSLMMNADIFPAGGGTGKSYIIYQDSPQSTIGNTGCVLYVGTAGNVVIETMSGDVVTFFNVNSGQFLPVQVHSVLGSTTASNILALW